MLDTVAPVHVFTTRDSKELTLTRKRNDAGAGAVPVLLVHGAGVRSRIFEAPRETGRNVGDMLADAGFDVWSLDWRASIEQPPNEWDLDLAAVHDHPAAVRYIREATGASEVRAVIHCQGSTSFMLALVAGLLPDVSVVVANAVSLHPVVPRIAELKQRVALPTVGCFVTYLNPQWGISAPPGWPSFFDHFVRMMHHECNNPVCKWSSFVYGAGFPTLWRHENLTDETHEWLKGEFGFVPMTFFRQMSRCLAAGHLVTTGKFDELPASVAAQAPRTDARVVLLAGELNDCFLPESQERSFDFLDRHAPGRHAFHQLAGYGHLDVFMGRDAPRDVFPLIVEEISRG